MQRSIESNALTFNAFSVFICHICAVVGDVVIAAIIVTDTDLNYVFEVAALIIISFF